MHPLDRFTFEREYDSIEDIDLRVEMRKRYENYPNSIVSNYIRNGIYNVKEMKDHLESIDQLFKIRNIGPKRLVVARRLLNKYENEAIKKKD